MNTYEISYSFFLSNEDNSEEYAQMVASEIECIQCVDTIDWYDDGEDYCFDIIAYIESKSKNISTIQNQFEKKISEIKAPGDYHYIKGTNTDFYWQP